MGCEVKAGSSGVPDSNLVRPGRGVRETKLARRGYLVPNELHRTFQKARPFIPSTGQNLVSPSPPTDAPTRCDHESRPRTATSGKTKTSSRNRERPRSLGSRTAPLREPLDPRPPLHPPLVWSTRARGPSPLRSRAANPASGHERKAHVHFPPRSQIVEGADATTLTKACPKGNIRAWSRIASNVNDRVEPSSLGTSR
jgi:hypothetical protein